MSSRLKSARRRPPVILVFGENVNDSQAIRSLAEFVNDNLAGKIKVRAKPVSLTRGSGSDATRRWAKNLIDIVEATERGGQPVKAVLVHRDADVLDATGSEEEALRLALSSIPFLVPVVPVVTIESWWLYFVDATESCVADWAGRLPRNNSNRDLIAAPKSLLRERTRPSRREYQENDSPSIAAAVKDYPGKSGSSPSFTRFAEKVAGIAI